MSKSYNIAPYYDDYSEDKNFVSMLFVPERAVQARELTQLQTILRNQNSKFADHFFKDGSRIIGGKIELDQTIISLDISTFTGFVNPSDLVGLYIKGYVFATQVDTGASAKVIYANDTTGKIFLKTRGGVFTAGDYISTVDVDNVGAPVGLTAQIDAVGSATQASLSPGIVYIAGNFVKTVEQTIIIDEDVVSSGTDKNIQIGFALTEDEVSFDQDYTLLDPAKGAYNYNAPGADRYRSYVELVAYDPSAVPSDGSFFPKMFIIKYANTTEYYTLKEEEDVAYADILDLLAKRTYETNGDYTVDPFLSKTVADESDDTKFNFILDAGIAYVKGYRHETISETVLSMDKARDFLTKTESVWIDHSPYITLKREDMTYYPSVSNLEQIEFYATDASDVANWGTTSKVIGTARVIGLTFTGTEYRLYLTDHSSILGDVASVKGVKSVSGSFIGSTILEAADEFNPAHTVLYSTTGSRINLFPLAQENIKSNDASKFIHRVQKNLSATVSANIATIGTISTEEIDLSQNPIVSDPTGVILVPNVDYVTSGSSTTELVIDLTAMGVGAPASVNVHYFVEITGGQRKTKLVSTYVETVTVGADGIADLNFEDCIGISTVIRDPAGTPSSVDVSTLTLDGGGRDFYYDKGQITGLPGADDYEITYTYYIHGGSGNYFDINSYTNSGIDPEDVPVYNSILQGASVFLGDVIDFRRKLTDITGGGAPVPTPRSYMFIDYEYYLDRVDLVELDKDGNFNVLKGVSSLDPVAPEGSDNAMSLYTVNIPAYTYSISKINPTFIENKNYTMRDIGELEQRIGNLEYYSSLNLLEKDAASLDITDEFGNNRFKNGILADNFMGGNVVDVNDPEYFCAMDPDLGHLRPVFDMKDLDLHRDASNHTLQDNGDGTFSDLTNKVRFHPNSVTIEYTEVNWVSQLQASDYMNVNPYNVFSWDGNLTLIPDTDYWMDTEWLPDIVTNVDGLYDNMIQKQINAYGTKWGSWKTNWTGRPQTSSYLIRNKRRRHASGGFHSDSSNTGWVKRVTRTTTTKRQTRQGTRLVAIPNRIEKVKGTRVVDVSVIPYMRSIPVQFEAKNLKPNVDLHCFFNDVDVDSDITPDAGYEPSDTSFAIRTNGSGKCKGTFQIPANSQKRFRTGQRPFTLIDDTFHPTTSAEAEFLAAGHLQKKQRDILSISKPILSVVGVSQSRTTSSTRENSKGWFDPVAETFLVEQEGGIFLTSIEVFFKTKDAELPVSIMVVETENGYPSQNQLPFANATLDPADVNLSDDSSVGTTFTFSDPVYLLHKTEYAFIVYSNSDSYNIWVGKMGAFDVQKLPNEERIQKQPYAGVFFKSQNGSTWSADQNIDLKFNLNRAKFETKSGDLTEADLYMIDNLDIWDGDGDFVTATNFTFDATGKTITSPSVDFAVFDAGDIVTISGTVSNNGSYTVASTPSTNTLTVVESLINETPGGSVKITDAQQVDLYATTAQFEIDKLEFDLTECNYAYKFYGDSLFSQAINGEEISLTNQKHITNDVENGGVLMKRCEVNVAMFTENDWVSPVVSVNRSHVIIINNTLFGWNKLPYENINKPLLTDPTFNAQGQYDAGVYVSRPTTLVNPSDDIKVIMDVWKDGDSDVNVFFSTGKFTPKYIEVYDTDVPTVRPEMAGNKLYLYGRASADDSITLRTELSGTSINEDTVPNRIYVTGVGDPSQFKFQSEWGTDNRQFVTPEEIDLTGTVIIQDWSNLTDYTIGDYVFHGTDEYLWKALEASGPGGSGAVTPDAYGTAWQQISFNDTCETNGVTGEEIKTDDERNWRPLKIESQDNDEGAATSDFVEYTFIPADVVEEEFSSFQIKIQLLAKDPAYIPKVSALRAIATY